ncbi:hypothetical protein SUGI_0912540 [Cryptomeria japonica]|nr:hypothetical protein SUGI_0912540 [Cryptomeria japonica]
MEHALHGGGLSAWIRVKMKIKILGSAIGTILMDWHVGVIINVLYEVPTHPHQYVLHLRWGNTESHCL